MRREHHRDAPGPGILIGLVVDCDAHGDAGVVDDDIEPAENARRSEALEFQMKLAAMRAERSTLLDLRGSQLINDDTLNKLMREVDLSETALQTRGKGKK